MDDSDTTLSYVFLISEITHKTSVLTIIVDCLSAILLVFPGFVSNELLVRLCAGISKIDTHLQLSLDTSRRFLSFLHAVVIIEKTRSVYVESAFENSFKYRSSLWQPSISGELKESSTLAYFSYSQSISMSRLQTWTASL